MPFSLAVWSNEIKGQSINQVRNILFTVDMKGVSYNYVLSNI